LPRGAAKQHGINQAQFVEHLGISQKHMASFEKGISKVPASTLLRTKQRFVSEMLETIIQQP